MEGVEGIVLGDEVGVGETVGKGGTIAGGIWGFRARSSITEEGEFVFLERRVE